MPTLYWSLSMPGMSNPVESSAGGNIPMENSARRSVRWLVRMPLSGEAMTCLCRTGWRFPFGGSVHIAPTSRVVLTRQLHAPSRVSCELSINGDSASEQYAASLMIMGLLSVRRIMISYILFFSHFQICLDIGCQFRHDGVDHSRLINANTLSDTMSSMSMRVDLWKFAHCRPSCLSESAAPMLFLRPWSQTTVSTADYGLMSRYLV